MIKQGTTGRNTKSPFEIEEIAEESQTDHDEMQQFVRLLHRSESTRSLTVSVNTNSFYKKNAIRLCCVSMLVLVAGVLFRVGNAGLDTRVTEGLEVHRSDSEECLNVQKRDQPFNLTEGTSDVWRFACPCQTPNEQNLSSSINAKDRNRFVEHTQFVLANVTEYLRVFRDLELDEWGYSYTEWKNGMLDWKRDYFAANLKSNSSIYESACGIGMGLFLTLEILHDLGKIENLVIYGNDLVAHSIEALKKIESVNGFPGGARLGQVCAADSVDLSYIPANSFDLVYSSYISPVIDPLDLQSQKKLLLGQDVFTQYSALCEEKDGADAVQMKRTAQHVQDRWFARWFGEMIRIAKPGAPIIAEHVSYP